MDCIIYIRWSSAEQAKGSSLERQEQDCRQHAAVKGWNVLHTLIDDGVSAFKGKHASTGALSNFVADVEAGEYPAGVILLTEKLDRLSREEPGRVFMWMMRMTEAGVVVATVDGDRRYARGTFDMASIIEVVVKAQLAHEESEKKASRLSAAWASKRAKLARGEQMVMTKRAPAWLRVEGTPPRFAVIEDRAEIVRRIFADTVAGFGKHHIARQLNQEGVPTFGRASGWHASYVQKILNSSAVLGELQPGTKPRGEARTSAGEPISAYYPAIVDADLHARAKASMAKRSRLVSGRGRRLVNLLAGSAHCGPCGSKMTFRGKGLKQRAGGEWVNEDYLVCDGYQRGRGCSNKVHYNYELWENAVLDAILKDAIGDKHFAAPRTVKRLEIELAETERQRTATQGKLAAALNLFVESEAAEVKELWLSLKEADKGMKEEAVDLRKQIAAARGVMKPEAHQRRIAELRESLRADDESTRFQARAKVMEAIHDLVDHMSFGPGLNMQMMTLDERDFDLFYDDVGGGIQCDVTEGPS